LRTTTETGDRLAEPVHPGEFIWTEIIEPHGLTVTAAAAVLGVSRVQLSRLINQQASLSGDMALRVEKAFGVSMDTLLRMQAAYDIAATRGRERTIHVRRYRGTAA
jgi:antitoxin HigA-1